MPIVVENVSFTYMRGTPLARRALCDVSLRIEEGEFVGVIGRTGSGKSTLIQHLNGILKPESGAVTVDGERTTSRRLKDLRRKVGLVFQFPEYQLFEETVWKDIAFGISKLGFSDEEKDRRVRDAAAAAGFPERMLWRSPFELSGGQRRRAAIAGVLAMEPRYLVMDEPASGLDPQGREEILGYAARLGPERGVCVVLVSHSMDDIARYARRVVVMSEGRVAMDGPTRDVFSRIGELESLGLKPPDIQYFMRMFKETVAQGVDCRALTPAEAAAEVGAWLRGRVERSPKGFAHGAGR